MIVIIDARYKYGDSFESISRKIRKAPLIQYSPFKFVI